MCYLKKVFQACQTKEHLLNHRYVYTLHIRKWQIVIITVDIVYKHYTIYFIAMDL